MQTSQASRRFAPSILHWLPVLWTRILFPGRRGTEEETRGAWRWLAVVILPGALLYPSLGFHLFEPDEGRYAEIPREMLDRGEWIVPYLDGEPYLDKPPLLYWLVMASYRLFGVSEGAARLIPALALHGVILLVYAMGRRSVGNRAAFWGATLLALAPGFVTMGRLLLLDGLLSLWVVAGLFSALEAVRDGRLCWSWWLLAAIATGLGVLTKGPVAVILVLPPVVLHALLNGSALRNHWRAILVFGAVVAAVAGPWFAMVCVRAPTFGRYFLWQHNVVRFLEGFDHQKPVWFYGPVLLAALLPATLFAVPVVRFLLSGREEIASRRTPELGFLLLGGGWCVVFFSLSGSKLPTYIMPALAPLALVVGVVVASGRTHYARALTVVFGLLVALGHHVALPWYAHYRSPMARPDEVTRWCSDAGAVVVCHPRPCDSLAFYLERADLRHFRSKDMHELIDDLRSRPRTVVLFTHRHSLHGFHEAVPPDLHIVAEQRQALAPIPGVPRWLMDRAALLMGETAEGLCDIAVIERTPPR